MTSIEFRDRLFRLWNKFCECAYDHPDDAPKDFHLWDGTTKDLLMGLGMRYDSKRDCYTFDPE